MMEFLKNMLSDGTDVSSKRVSGFLTLIVLLFIELVVVGYLMFKGTLQDYLFTIFGSLIGLICTFFGLTLSEMPWVK